MRPQLTCIIVGLNYFPRLIETTLGITMTDISDEPRPILPFLRPFYDFVGPLAWPIVRIALAICPREPTTAPSEAYLC